MTLPLMRNLYSFFTGTHKCPLRMTQKLSDMHSL